MGPRVGVSLGEHAPNRGPGHLSLVPSPLEEGQKAAVCRGLIETGEPPEARTGHLLCSGRLVLRRRLVQDPLRQAKIHACTPEGRCCHTPPRPASVQLVGGELPGELLVVYQSHRFEVIERGVDLTSL